ncbi:hypothetical protein [Paenibacillus agricola]|uniref:Uncharacterized protein n=1 Tax=Paenibacillus agricola TaxID=2716264 RepID=A0ABX0JI46_9BACL|nr:hypothetical protein [Paenibacillus agricola]NHN34363.1 hypothetical protein [Paenibacillus agricola]
MRNAQWEGSPELKALENEIMKYPESESNSFIFRNMSTETWALLERGKRMNGKTKEYAVYRQICKMRQKNK